MTRPDVLSLIGLSDRELRILGAGYRIHDASGAGGRATFDALRPTVRAVLTSGSVGYTEVEMASTPRLGIVCVSGAGLENVDVAAARRRGILVAGTPGANAPSVADHALGLLLALSRQLVRYDRVVRAGGWRDRLGTPPEQISGRRLGILGLGNVGRGIARRAVAFDMHVSYHGRTPRDDVSYEWRRSVVELAHASDFLVVAASAGPATRGIVDREVLGALGPAGYLVNVSRGDLVVTADLIAALQEGRIAGAALDVFADEPRVPEPLRALPNTVLTPHIAGQSPESLVARCQHLVANLDAYFASRGRQESELLGGNS